MAAVIPAMNPLCFRTSLRDKRRRNACIAFCSSADIRVCHHHEADRITPLRPGAPKATAVGADTGSDNINPEHN